METVEVALFVFEYVTACHARLLVIYFDESLHMLRRLLGHAPLSLPDPFLPFVSSLPFPIFFLTPARPKTSF